MNYSNQATRHKRHNLNVAILIVLVIISTACQPLAPSIPASTATPFSLVVRELRRNQQKWQNAGISNYRFRLFRGCICEDNEDVLVEVKNEQIVSLEYQSGRTMNTGDRADFESLGTMARLFSTVETEFNGESLNVTVTYDSTYGFPVEVSSERSEGSDDELYLTISDFEVLPQIEPVSSIRRAQ
jgi:hypothetical protein